MGTSTNAHLCYGAVFEEGYEFPWDESPFGGDFEEWWLIESGWKWEGESPYTPEGEYAPGFSSDDPRVDAYFDSRSAWRKSHPAPIEIVNFCSDSCPMYILCIPKSLTVARRGYPEVLDLQAVRLGVFPEDESALLKFCQDYNLTFESGPSWLLSSYWEV